MSGLRRARSKISTAGDLGGEGRLYFNCSMLYTKSEEGEVSGDLGRMTLVIKVFLLFLKSP